MPNYAKYLLTVDADTGVPVKLERVGEAGDLVAVDLASLQPPAMAVPAPSPSVVIHVYGGGGMPATVGAPPSGTMIVHQPSASIVHQPTPSIVHAPSASIVHQPVASIVHQPTSSIVHQPPGTTIVHSDATPPTDEEKK